jgi:hypothetical protein
MRERTINEDSKTGPARAYVLDEDELGTLEQLAEIAAEFDDGETPDFGSLDPVSPEEPE